MKGRINEAWSDRLEGLSIQTENQEESLPISTLQGVLLDQAALSGVLNTLYELHLPLLSVDCLGLRLESCDPVV